MLVLIKSEEDRLERCEREILKSFNGEIKKIVNWRRKTNWELEATYNELREWRTRK